MVLDVSHKTDLGNLRELNEDSCLAQLVSSGGGYGVRAVLAVSDGMGGHEAGDVASKMACDYIEHLFAKANHVRVAGEWNLPTDDYVSILSEAMHAVHRKISDRARSFQLQKAMGCTCVVGLIVRDEMRGQLRLIIGSVGDSRCYIIRKGEVLLATEDDSLVWQLYRNKEITYAEMRVHPKRNVLTQALGAQDVIRPHMHVVELHEGDSVVLCSDGFHGAVSEDELQKTVDAAESAEEAAEKLVSLANARGTRDNVAIAVALYRKVKPRTVRHRSVVGRAFAFGLPVVAIGVASALFLNPSPGMPDAVLPAHTLSAELLPSDDKGSRTLGFSVEPYSLIERFRGDYHIILDGQNRQDTLSLESIEEVQQNKFRLGVSVSPSIPGPVRLMLTHKSQARPLYESVLVMNAPERRPPPEVRRPSKKSAPAATASVKVGRGPDGFVLVQLGKGIEITGTVTAELTMDGVVELITLDSQHKALPKSTSMEYRSGGILHIRFLETPHTWTMTLP